MNNPLLDLLITAAGALAAGPLGPSAYRRLARRPLLALRPESRVNEPAPVDLSHLGLVRIPQQRPVTDDRGSSAV